MIWAFLGVLAGAASAAQTAVNSVLGQRVGILVAALLSAALTTAVLVLLVSPNLRPALLMQVLSGTPIYLYLGGVLGGGFVVSVIVLAPRIGVGPTTSAVVCGQVVASLLFDHFGLLGVVRTPISKAQVIGTSLLLAGTLLVVHFKHSG